MPAVLSPLSPVPLAEVAYLADDPLEVKSLESLLEAKTKGGDKQLWAVGETRLSK